MKPENLDKLTNLLREVIKTPEFNYTAYSIKSSQYHSLYFAIFFDELDHAGEPIGSGSFIEELGIRIKPSQEELEKVFDVFSTHWDAWTTLYRELDKKGRLK